MLNKCADEGGCELQASDNKIHEILAMEVVGNNKTKLGQEKMI